MSVCAAISFCAPSMVTAVYSVRTAQCVVRRASWRPALPNLCFKLSPPGPRRIPFVRLLYIMPVSGYRIAAERRRRSLSVIR
jgi:hypothetical protein